MENKRLLLALALSFLFLMVYQIVYQKFTNEAPTADAGLDTTLSDADGDGVEPVTLEGSGFDPDGNIVEFSFGQRIG